MSGKVIHICDLCKKMLDEETAKGLCLGGHYLFDGKMYCVDCWQKETISGSLRLAIQEK